MSRPRRCRWIENEPSVLFFKPANVRLRDMDVVVLSHEEIEAIRLKDFEKLDQNECARRMNISQPTFHRTIICAREKIADAVVNGKAIRIDVDGL
jgi:uncharacterized protein